MNLQDVRRFGLTTGILAGAMALALAWLALQENGRINSPTAQRLLDGMELDGWLWLGVVLLLVTLGLITSLLYLLQVAPRSFVLGILRQIQCQGCKAVFMIHDTGHRPITHRCPNCARLGVYDGTAPPVGEPPRPEPPKRIIELGLVCQQCSHDFTVTDTGVRPLTVKCPRCKARGKVV